MPIKPMRPDWRNAPRALGQIAQLMQTNSPIQAVRNTPDGITWEGPKHAVSWLGERFNVGPSYTTLTLDGYQALIRWDERDLLPDPFFAPMELRPLQVDDYTMLRLDDHYEYCVSCYHHGFQGRFEDVENVFLLDCVDSLAHCLRAEKTTPAKRALEYHFELPAWIVWYVQFIPFQRQATLRLGERFLMAHVVNAYQSERGMPV